MQIFLNFVKNMVDSRGYGFVVTVGYPAQIIIQPRRHCGTRQSVVAIQSKPCVADDVSGLRTDFATQRDAALDCHSAP
jgi:hypothetical protein